MIVDSPENFAALKACREAVRDTRKPPFYWIGAGASAWAGLPLWSDLAENTYKKFQSRLSPNERADAQSAIADGRLPEFFSLCKAHDPQLYLKTILDELTPPAAPPVYGRFIAAVTKVRPALIVTTNVEQCLEQNSDLPSVLFTDIEQVMNANYPGGCILKLHGCTSVTNSLVFTEEDYQHLIEQPGFLPAIEQLFSSRTAIFIGYGMRDQYVLDALEKANANRPLLGAGPHFCIQSDPPEHIRGNVKIIRYNSRPRPDHRSCIQIVEEIQKSREPFTPVPVAEAPARRSAHILSDIFLLGQNQTSQTAMLNSPDGKEACMVVGCGFVDSELPHLYSTAMHDTIVGLLCFDQLIAPTTIIAKLWLLLGGDIFMRLTREETLHFAHFQRTPAVFFPDAKSVTGGHLTNFFAAPQIGPPASVEEIVRQELRPVGDERAVTALVSGIAEKTSTLLDDSDETTQLVRSLMRLPSVRSDLGFADLVSLESIPTWLVHSILRLASVARIGKACRDLGLQSAKFEAGNEWLAGPVFTAAFGKETVDRVAAYVATGGFYGNLGLLVQENPGVLRTILSFRESSEGSELRKAVMANLARSEGAEVVAAVNGHLSGMLPSAMLEKAKVKFSELYLPGTLHDLPAVFLDSDRNNNPFLTWRRHSGQILSAVCKDLNIGRNSPCPCGSGEKFKFCCKPLTHA